MNRRTLLLLLLLTGMVVGCGKPTPTPPSAFCAAQPLNLQAEPRIPPVTAVDHVHGPADAPITVIEYADFQ